jgi:hypothetical protein
VVIVGVGLGGVASARGCGDGGAWKDWLLSGRGAREGDGGAMSATSGKDAAVNAGVAARDGAVGSANGAVDGGSETDSPSHSIATFWRAEFKNSDSGPD